MEAEGCLFFADQGKKLCIIDRTRNFPQDHDVIVLPDI